MSEHRHVWHLTIGMTDNGDREIPLAYCSKWRDPTPLYPAVTCNPPLLAEDIERRLNAFDALVAIAEIYRDALIASPEHFEAEADAFYRDTKMLAPGSRGSNPLTPYTERWQAWNVWRATQRAALVERIEAALRLARGDSEVRA